MTNNKVFVLGDQQSFIQTRYFRFLFLKSRHLYLNKAYDQIDHNLLILKLKTMYDFNDLLARFFFFLSKRQQIVKYKNFLWIPIKVSPGIPQGDHISPLLFLLFINDISLILKHSKMLLLADDTKIYKTIISTNDTLKLQSDLNNF